MRLKEYLICLAIFTVVYILFCVIYDTIYSNSGNGKLNSMLKKALKTDKYQKFANFYGIQPVATPDKIKAIYKELLKNNDIRLSETHQKYQVQFYELIVIILFLEHLTVIKKRSIIPNFDIATPIKKEEQMIIGKYYYNFANKDDFRTICMQRGRNAYNDLFYIETRFLVPGVRFINQTLYYYMGD